MGILSHLYQNCYILMFDRSLTALTYLKFGPYYSLVDVLHVTEQAVLEIGLEQNLSGPAPCVLQHNNLFLYNSFMPY